MNTKKEAFTLIEMLVVIAIIGIVAGLVINMNSAAAAAKRNSAVKAQKEKLVTMIENYQSKLNYYPPDNGNLAANANPSLYDGLTATNPLLYELTGATNLAAIAAGSPNIQVFNGIVSADAFSKAFNRSSVANSDPNNPQDFFKPGPQAKDYAPYVVPAGNPNPMGLLVPVPVNSGNLTPNFWHYDASSPNRHNLTTYDLWAEYITGGKNGTNIITTNGNW